MPKVELSGIVDALRTANSFLIAGHSNPDGDSIGSILAIYHLLHSMGKERILCLCDGPVPRVYQWLPGVDQIQDGKTVLVAPPEVAIIVDVATRDRLGTVRDSIGPETRVIILDHHLEEHPEGDLWHIEPSASAVGEIIADLYKAVDAPITPEAAECLYVSISTDTGGFRFANTTARTHRVAAALVATGIDVSEISSRVFDVMSPAKFELLRRLLQRIERDLDGRLAYALLTEQDMNDATARSEDAEGLVNYLRNIEGVEVGILFREVDSETTKVSIRSRNGFNCARFLRQFGGGGHARAAGATIRSSANLACSSILTSIRESLGGAA